MTKRTAASTGARPTAAGIQPYYQDDAVVIYYADARDVIAEMRDLVDAIDLVVTDPPYNIGFNGYHSYKDAMPEAEYIAMLAKLGVFKAVAISQYPEEMMRLVVPALGAPEHVSAWCYRANFSRRFRLINYYGVKPDYSRIRQAYRNLSDKRIIAALANGSEGSSLYEWWEDIDQVKNVSEEKTEHPCPLPQRLVERIITLCSDVGQVILDPFMGSGTTLRAAKDLGRQAIGIEIEERYCEIAAKRMAQSVMPMNTGNEADKFAAQEALL